MEIKLDLFSPEIVSALENEYIEKVQQVHKQTDGLLYTGPVSCNALLVCCTIILYVVFVIYILFVVYILIFLCSILSFTVFVFHILFCTILVKFLSQYDYNLLFIYPKNFYKNIK